MPGSGLCLAAPTVHALCPGNCEVRGFIIHFPQEAQRLSEGGWIHGLGSVHGIVLPSEFLIQSPSSLPAIFLPIEGQALPSQGTQVPEVSVLGS